MGGKIALCIVVSVPLEGKKFLTPHLLYTNEIHTVHSCALHTSAKVVLADAKSRCLNKFFQNIRYLSISDFSKQTSIRHTLSILFFFFVL